MTYVWTELSGKYKGSLATTNPRILRIDEGQLLATEAYMFQCFVALESNTASNNSATVVVEVVKQDIIARIAGGAERTAGTDQALTLDASGSSDPDEMNSTWSYTWSCLNATSEAACTKSDGTTALVLAPNATLALPGLTLSEGTYEFSMLVKKDDRNDTVTTTIIVAGGSPPVVSIGDLSKAKYNPIANSYVSLDGSVSSVLGVKSTAWTQIDSSETGVFLPGSDRRPRGVIKLSALTEGKTYTFRLTGADRDGQTSYAQVELVVNEKPSSGSLAVTPSRGYPFETDFTYLAESWVDADLPLAYKFVYTVGYAGDETPVADAQTSASFDCILPQGTEADNYTLTATVYVYDTYSAYSTASDTVRVLPAQLTTGQLANVSEALSKEALETKDPEACMQVLGATHKSLSGGSQGSDGRRRLLESTSSALRTSMLRSLEATYALSDITQANIDSMLSTVDGIVNAPNDLSAATAVDSMVFVNKLLRKSADEDIGISDVGTAYAGKALSYLLYSAIFNGSDVVTAMGANNVSDALAHLSEAQLYGSYAGLGYTVSSGVIHMNSVREEAQYLSGRTIGVPGGNARFTFPSNISSSLKVPMGDNVDARVATIDVDIYSSGFDWINSDVTQIEMTHEGAPLRVSGLPSDDPVLITLNAVEEIDTNFSAWVREGVCDHGLDNNTLTFDCPLGPHNYTCDFGEEGGVDGTYFVEFTCPGILPACLWWNDAEADWSGDGCEVANYTSTNVTCECSHLTDFVLGQNVSAARVLTSYTSSPTSLPSPAPTEVPTSGPSIMPTPVPSSVPTPLPTTQAQSRAPTQLPTTPSPTVSPTLIPTPLPTLGPWTEATASSSMVLDGFENADAFTEDHKTAFIKSLVASQSVVNSTSAVSDINVTNIRSASRRRQLSASTTEVEVGFTITVTLEDYGFDPTASGADMDAFGTALIDSFSDALADAASDATFLTTFVSVASNKPFNLSVSAVTVNTAATTTALSIMRCAPRPPLSTSRRRCTARPRPRPPRRCRACTRRHTWWATTAGG